MKINGRVPLVHLGRLRQGAREAECFGLLECIDAMAKSFLARKYSTRDEKLDLEPVGIRDDPVLDAAWEKLCDIIEARYKEQEEQIEAEYGGLYDDDCTAIMPRFFIKAAEVVPTLCREIREPLDRYFAELAKDQAIA